MRTLFLSLFLLAASLVHSQCSPRSFVLSPTIGKAPGHGVSVNLEAGYLTYASKTYLSVKSGLWSETATLRYTNAKGENVAVENSKGAGFVGLNYGYAPMAFANEPRKWLLGAAAGLLWKEGESGRPASLLSAAYTVRMAAGNYGNGIACLKFEGTCLVSSLGVKPGMSAGVFLVL